MAGQSDQEKAMEKLFGDSRALSNKVDKQNFNVNNLFSNYNSEYGADAQTSALGEYFSGLKSDAARTFGRDESQAGSDTGAMLASQGIGGSIALDAVNKAKSNVRSDKYDYMNKLDTAEAGNSLDILKNAENMDFRRLTGEQNVLNNNMGNEMNRFNMMFRGLNTQGGFASNLDDDTWLDDSLAIMNSVGSVAQGAGSLATGGFFGGQNSIWG